MTDTPSTLGIVGGTGKLGMALGRRWAKAGHRIVIGSRDMNKARQTAQALSQTTDGQVEPASNLEAAERGHVVVVTVPFAAQTATLEEIRPAVSGKIVVDTTVPLMPPKVMRVQLPPEGSAAMRARAALGDSVTLVSAFHNVAAHRLATDEPIDCDVLVFGDDKHARSRVIRLCGDAGLRGIHAGALVNAVAAEALTSVLIFVNRAHAVDGAGLRITGSFGATAEE